MLRCLKLVDLRDKNGVDIIKENNENIELMEVIEN